MATLGMVVQKTWQEFLLLLKAPILESSMWWIILPLIVTFVAMTFYFGTYRKEELGWNTAVANTIVLMFVVIDLIRRIYYYSIPPSTYNFLTHIIKTAIILLIFIEALLLFFTAFKHAIPKKIMFFLASPLPVNIQAYVIISIVYLRKTPTWYTLLAAIFLFILLFLLSKGIQAIQGLFIKKTKEQKKKHKQKDK